jgi:spore maturation protein CgeB
MDTGVTVERARAGASVDWIGPEGLGGFDLVLSYTGGRALAALTGLGARRVAPLYGSVDPAVHPPAPPLAAFAGELSYLGTYAPSRQATVEALFLAPAARLPSRTFVLAGSMYGADFPWRENVRYVRHLEPALHPSFFCASPLTLSVTRAEMAALGWCPSGRLFEAAACGVPVLSDPFDGLEDFFTPGEEILVARGTDDAVAAVETPRETLRRMGARARERALAEHTADARARELVELCQAARSATQDGASAGTQEQPARALDPARPERSSGATAPDRSRGATTSADAGGTH